ncbi:MAG: hypothetical protein AAF602_16470 [Myxococcota bacterium]
MLAILAVLLGSSWGLAAGIAEECLQFADDRPPDYSEDQQRDYLQNYFALGGSFSGVHGPIPHEPGRGMVGVRLNGLPPLSCRRRFALDWTKTERTNISPVLPSVTASYAFRSDKVVPYVETGFLPPVPVAGTRNFVFQVAAGVGWEVTDRVSLGVRAHSHLQRTIGEIATPITEGAEEFDDFYVGTAIGGQVLGGYRIRSVTPYVMVGLVGVSTFFDVGDSGLAVRNFHPYLGPEYAIGVDGLHQRLRLGAEYYGAPGGSRNLRNRASLGFFQYGRLHTLRVRVGVEL